MTSFIKVTFITIVIKVTWTRGRSAHSLAPYSGSPSTRPRHIQSFQKKIFDILCSNIWHRRWEFLHKSYEHIVTWVEKAHPHLWWFPLLVLQRGRWWCSLARPNVGWTLELGNKKPRQLSSGRNIITWVHQLSLSPGSTRTWKASLVPLPWKMISSGSLLPEGMDPTTSMIRPWSPQKSRGNFILRGRLTSYKVNSEAKVIGLSGSAKWTSPVSFGGNGICWQAVAAQGSRAGGDQVRSQLQRNI